MWPSNSVLILISTVFIIGTIHQIYHNYIVSVFMKSKSSVLSESFKLNEEPITGDIVVYSENGETKNHLLPQCQQPLHHGVQQCTNSSSLRYFMDTATDTCLAFKFSGCGGNANNFETSAECYANCFAADYSGCPVASKPVPNTDNSTNCGRKMYAAKCSGPDSYCKSGAFDGICCSKIVRDKLSSDENLNEGCGPGQHKVRKPIKTGRSQYTLLGKSCSSNFCPQKSTCHQGNYFAYCCTSIDL